MHNGILGIDPIETYPELISRLKKKMKPLNGINYDDFKKIDIRVGTVLKAELFPEAHKASMKLWVDFGQDIGELKTSAQITVNYSVDEVVGKKVAAVVNFPPKQIGPFMSECLILGFPDEAGEVVLISLDKDVPDGGKLF